MKDSFFPILWGYLHEVGVELKKTTWPTRAELIRATWIVLGTVSALGVYLALLDAFLSRITQPLGLFR